MMSLSHADEIPNPRLLSVEHALRRCNEEKHQRRQKRIEYKIFVASLNEQKGSRRSSAPPINLWHTTLPAPQHSPTGSLSSRSSISSYNSLWSSNDKPSKRSSLSSLESTFSTVSLSGSAVGSFTSPKPRLNLAQTRRSTILEGLLEYRDLFLPARFFHSLPEQIYDCILNQLRSSHFGKNKAGCVECYLRDLRSLSRTSRPWRRMAEKHMFKVLYISKSHIAPENRGLKIKTSTRLKTLRNKLRSRPDLASHVKILRVDADVTECYRRSPQAERAQIMDLLASLIMSCPKLSSLEGFYPEYDQRFDRLSQALRTRSYLKERIWRLVPPTLDMRRNDDSFMSHSDMWSSLKSLVLQGPGTEGCLDYRAFVGTFRKLPRLRRLVIANFAPADFHDRTLAALPAIDSVRLERLPGVSDKGLSRFARTLAAQTIQNLALVDLQVKSINTIRVILGCPNIQRFTLQQDSSPVCPLDPAVEIQLLASATLDYLHWDILAAGQTHCVLFDSLAAGNFPCLRRLRCVNDHNGLLQRICRPAAQAIYLPDDLLMQRKSSASGPRDSTRSLTAARREAQNRISEARSRPAARIVIEENGKIQQIHEIGGFVGRIGSAIDFVLEPDVISSDTALAHVEDIFEGYGNGGLMEAPVCGGGIKQEWSHKAKSLCVQLDTSSLF